MKKTVREVIKLLEDNGWVYKSTKGDHHKFYKPGARRPIIVNGKASDDMKEGTLASILRESGLHFD